MEAVKLNTGAEMPIIGLGTFKIHQAEMQTSLDAALAAGYRSIDTASVYRNECHIATVLEILLPKYNLERKNVFITSKLGPKQHGTMKCREACMKSISDLKCNYLDLYLIHWPGTQGLKLDDVKNAELRKESWMEMERLHKAGYIKAIGVSNYTIHHMKELLQYCTVVPAVLQIEHHPHLVQKELVQICREKGIHFQAYSSLGTTSIQNKLLCDPVVTEISQKYRRRAAQVLLRWAVQQGIGVLPKSTNPEHIKENIDIFSFSMDDCDIDRLNNLNSAVHYCWNPETVT